MKQATEPEPTVRMRKPVTTQTAYILNTDHKLSDSSSNKYDSRISSVSTTSRVSEADALLFASSPTQPKAISPKLAIAKRPANQETEEVELRLELSDEEHVVSMPKSRTVDSSGYERQLEDSLERKSRMSRSSSKSPDLDANNSHMYIRSTGFRAKPAVSPRSHSSSTAGSIHSPDQMSQRSASVDNSSVHSQNSIKYSTRLSLNSPTDGATEIPITHLSSPASPRAPVSPDERPAYNPGYLSESLRKGTRQHASYQNTDTPIAYAPTPQPRSPNYITPPTYQQLTSLHLSSQEQPHQMYSPSSDPPYAVPRTNYHAQPRQQTPRHLEQNSSGFHTFSGRGSGQVPPPPPVRTHFHNIQRPTTLTPSQGVLSLGLDGTPHLSSTLPTRFVSQHHHQPNQTNKYYYVTQSPKSPSNRRAPNSRSPTTRYQFDEDSPHEPVVL